MKQKTVLIAGLIGLVFGVLFSGTLGLDFFGEDPVNENSDDTSQVLDPSGLKKDEAAFREAYNLDTSIYEPITGDMAYQMIENNESFILYAGRDTCPYCQQFVPVLMEAAENQNVKTIYHIDTTDKLNADFKEDKNINATPTTFIYEDGVLVATIIGYKNLQDTEAILVDNLS